LIRDADKIMRYNLIENFPLRSGHVKEILEPSKHFRFCLYMKHIYLENFQSLRKTQEMLFTLYPYRMFATNRRTVALFEQHVDGKFSCQDILDYQHFPLYTPLREPLPTVNQLRIKRNRILAEILIEEIAAYAAEVDQIDKQIDQIIASDPLRLAIRKRREDDMLKAAFNSQL